MRGFIVDTQDDNLVVYIGDLRHKPQLEAPRYLRVPITGPDLEPPAAQPHTVLRFVDGVWHVTPVPPRQDGELSLSSPTLAQDLARALAERGLIRIKED